MKIVVGILLSCFFGTMILMAFLMSSSEMEMGKMSDCPFMSHQEVVCPMDIAAHMDAWKALFESVLPVIVTLIAVVTLTLVQAPHLLVRRRADIPILQQRLRERTYSFTWRPLQECFSNGILHSKAF